MAISCDDSHRTGPKQPVVCCLGPVLLVFASWPKGMMCMFTGQGSVDRICVLRFLSKISSFGRRVGFIPPYLRVAVISLQKDSFQNWPVVHLILFARCGDFLPKFHQTCPQQPVVGCFGSVLFEFASSPPPPPLSPLYPLLLFHPSTLPSPISPPPLSPPLSLPPPPFLFLLLLSSSSSASSSFSSYSASF
jgi:hypothetical protein